jgi:trehalose/maltose hydrolase-like predicted phosphorylase
MISGFSGEHPTEQIEAAAEAPYPLAADIALNGVWMSDVPGQVNFVEQAYDFGNGELTTELELTLNGVKANARIVTFCSRDQPTIVCQDILLRFDTAVDAKIRAIIDCRSVEGRARTLRRSTSSAAGASCDGVLGWESSGGISTCAIAYATTLQGSEVEPDRPALKNNAVYSEYSLRCRAGRNYRLSQIACVVPSALHQQPDIEAVRLLGKAFRDGLDSLRTANQACWQELWKGRIRLLGADERWQAMADAAFFYMNTSAHSSSPASTSMFGLSTWRDYHYYYGHVMWDIEAFAVPPLTLFAPDAAAALLNYRSRSLSAAHRNAQLQGRRGLQFPWASAPSTGEEATPMPGTASWYEDHASLDVALAFSFYADVTGQERFLREHAWPVLAGVADWLASRVTKTARGYEIKQAMGIAEREEAADNAAFTNMAACVVLDRAAEAACRLGRSFDPAWSAVRTGLVIPRRGDVVVSHDGFRLSEDKAATPDPLLGIFPLGYKLEPAVERATLDFYLGQADKYAGAPMLSALLGAWAARTGDRELAAKLLEDGYGRFCTGRFMQTLEYRPDVFPDEPRASPFMANIGGFLTALLLGFPGILPKATEPQHWPERPVVLPEGWDAIEVDRLWVRGRPTSLSARHGASRAVLEPVEAET